LQPHSHGSEALENEGLAPLRILHHHVTVAMNRIDLSRLKAISLDETKSRAKGTDT